MVWELCVKAAAGAPDLLGDCHLPLEFLCLVCLLYTIDLCVMMGFGLF